MTTFGYLDKSKYIIHTDSKLNKLNGCVNLTKFDDKLY